ncbi:MAG TPA: DinB family protein [Jatrophihabitantaceae bacterium]
MAAAIPTASEREGLASFLDRQREALVKKVQGVGDDDARRAPTVSSLSLLGLVKHSTVWEQRWFHCVVGGRSLADGWPERKASIADEDFLVGGQDTVEAWVTRYEAAVETSRQIVAATELDDPCVRTDIIECNVRCVVLHMIEETARHAGHADIIRETLDGSRGT